MKTPDETSGAPPSHPAATAETADYVTIRGAEKLAPFLINVVTPGSGWLFAGSNGAVTAGRVSPSRAVLPYRNADQMLASREWGGLYAAVRCGGSVWEPFAARPEEGVARVLRKHVTGGALALEEEHAGLGLRLGWEIAFSEPFGLLKRAWIENTGARGREARVLEGWRHILPPGLPDGLYASMSYLARAYMRHEALPGGTVIYSLNVGVSDRAEPCESLRCACATLAWPGGPAPRVLASEAQLAAFWRGEPLRDEPEVRGLPGAHFVEFAARLAPGERIEWWTTLDTWLDHARLAERVSQAAAGAPGPRELREALAEALRRLGEVIAKADGWQVSGDPAIRPHHAANALFNVMRGGLPEDGLGVPEGDFAAFLGARNRPLLETARAAAPGVFQAESLPALRAAGEAAGGPDLARLAREYLPLTFSRRHGDPSRPWNKFSIETADEAGRPVRNYQGNWRDLFQNWEALAVSYPALLPSMIAVFLNASTADGFNPYRIERGGADWEVPDPEDPWSNIGYWGDHQIVYLTRLLEAHEAAFPGVLAAELDRADFVFAGVPYRIRPLADRLRDPRDTIRFDWEAHERCLRRAAETGGDGRLLRDAEGRVVRATLAAKLLIPVLVKIGNLVPGGGVWLNTQRPEWNDANNALAGWGLSVVTTAQLFRHLAFLEKLFGAGAECHLPAAARDLLRELAALAQRARQARPETDPAARFVFLRDGGEALDRFWARAYTGDLGGAAAVSAEEITGALQNFRALTAATLGASRRADGLFHSYNLLEIRGAEAHVGRLDLMLEGQVAVLASGWLPADEAPPLLEAMRRSPLWREDQRAYLLYPNREVRPVLERNTFEAGGVSLFAELAAAGDRSLAVPGRGGRWHFAPGLRNPRDLAERLGALGADARFREAVARERGAVMAKWEEVFGHSRFTGRSGGMFAFEGLGSVYWHMAAKLLLAVGELAVAAPAGSEAARALAAHYSEIRSGLGFKKTAAEFGAFPCDPYSHTPAHAGAQQPGMTGQVKEEILTRSLELGARLQGGVFRFEPALMERAEFEGPGGVLPLAGGGRLHVPPGCVGFTVCGVPVVYELAAAESIEVVYRDGRPPRRSAAPCLTPAESQSLIARDGAIREIRVAVPTGRLLL